MAARQGKQDEALRRFSEAVNLAESSDPYCAAWLIASCADDLIDLDANGGVKASVREYSQRVRKLGYAEMTRRYDALIQR
jgi:hypothetical protein